MSRVPEDMAPRGVGYIIQIMDDVVGILAFYPLPFFIGTMSKSQVEIINWRTGQTYASIETPGTDSLVFLDYETILLPTRTDAPARRMSFDVYRFGHSPLPPGAGPDPQPVRGARLLSSLEFPKTQGRTAIMKSVARCEPALSYRTTPTNRTSIFKHPEKTFRVSQSSRIITLSFSTLQHGEDGHLTERPYVVIVHAESIRQLALNTRSTVPWGMWGEAHTRWFNTGAPSNWICYSFGTRFLRRYPYLADRLELLEFHPSAIIDDQIQTDGDAKTTKFNRIQIIKLPTVLPAIEWAHSIVSSLPYRMTSTESGAISNRVCGAMIDDERVIVVVSKANSISPAMLCVHNV